MIYAESTPVSTQRQRWASCAMVPGVLQVELDHRGFSHRSKKRTVRSLDVINRLLSWLFIRLPQLF